MEIIDPYNFAYFIINDDENHHYYYQFKVSIRVSFHRTRKIPFYFILGHKAENKTKNKSKKIEKN